MRRATRWVARVSGKRGMGGFEKAAAPSGVVRGGRVLPESKRVFGFAVAATARAGATFFGGMCLRVKGEALLHNPSF